MTQLDNYQLFTKPSFIEGLGRVIDFWGSISQFHISPTEQQADFDAMKSDWEHVGRDMKVAIEEYRKQEAINE